MKMKDEFDERQVLILKGITSSLWYRGKHINEY